MRYEFACGTYNVHHRRPDGSVTKDVEALSKDADILCLQEMGGHQGVLDHLPLGWEYYVPIVTHHVGRADCPILYSTATFDFKRGGYRKASVPTTVEEGAGGNTVPEKVVTWAVLAHKPSVTDVLVLNLHAVASVEGSQGRPNAHHPKRLALFDDMMHTVQAMVRHHTARHMEILVCGDFNVGYMADSFTHDRRFPFSMLRQVNVRSSYLHLGATNKEGTEGNRLIDYVCHRISDHLQPIRQQISSGLGSDHKALVVTYALDAPADVPPAP